MHFIKLLLGDCFTFYILFFFHFILLVEFLKGAGELSCLNWLSPLWRVQLMLTFWLCRGKNPLIHRVT